MLWSALDSPDARPRAFPAMNDPGGSNAVVPRLAPAEVPPAPPADDPRPPHSPRVPATPPRLEIPAIGVRAHARPLGTTAAGALEVPDNWSVVGWWRGGSKPGERGASVIVGHVDSRSRPAVFHDLGELEPGDTIRFVPRKGAEQRFVVVRKQRVSKESFPTAEVYGETPVAALRLITCGGGFDWSSRRYRDNLIVYAEKLSRRAEARSPDAKRRRGGEASTSRSS